MATRADWWKYQDEPGNDRLTVVVDLALHRITLFTARMDVRFNRNVGSGAVSEVRWVRGFLTSADWVLESVKAGVELKRPRWRFLPSSAPAVILSTVGCAGYARSFPVNFVDPLLQEEGVIIYRPVTVPASSFRVMTPPFKWASYYRGAGNLCT